MGKAGLESSKDLYEEVQGCAFWNPAVTMSASPLLFWCSEIVLADCLRSSPNSSLPLGRKSMNTGCFEFAVLIIHP